MSDAVNAAADVLYAADPDRFTATRAELAAAAKAAGDRAAAAQISALRKPTAAASLVNRLVLADDSVAQRLSELGDRLRHAHDLLDATALRDLTTERRALVADLARTAAATASAPIRDEVSGTLDAAVADPAVAARLGRLTKAERWSGFGVAPAGPPSLTVVRGARAAAPARSASRTARTNAEPTARTAQTDAERTAQTARTSAEPTARSASRTARTNAEPTARSASRTARTVAEPTPPAVPRAARRKLDRALERARDAFDAAEAGLADADAAERAAGDDLREVTAELAELTARLEDAKRKHADARKAARTARTQRREARSALDRAERNAERGS